MGLMALGTGYYLNMSHILVAEIFSKFLPNSDLLAEQYLLLVKQKSLEF